VHGDDAFEAAAPYFELSEGEFLPGPLTRSPWSPDMLHGRLLAGLAARAVEQGHAGEVFQVARLTVDLFRSPPVAPVRVETSLVRDGRRVRTVNCVLWIGGREVVRAHALLLRRGEQPTGQVWTEPPWSAPGPEELPPPAPSDEPRGFGAPELRMVSPGGFTDHGQKRLWLRERRALVAGEPLSPVARIVMAADLANPLANWSDAGLQFINADLTVYLVRDAATEWIGLEVAGHLSDAGVAFGHCNLYDIGGPIGHCSVAAAANPVLLPP